MLTIDAVNRIIELANAIQAYWDRELPKAHPEYPLVHEGETSPPEPAEQKALQAFVNSLPEGQLHKALLTVRVGRADISVDNIIDGYAQLKQEFPDKDSAINRILDTTALGDYLSDGVERLKRESIDIDSVTDDSVPAT